jgi:hypothetical protein
VDERTRIEFRGGRFSFTLRGWRAGVLLWVPIALIACIPAAAALFAYAEGGTTLWVAIAFSVGLPLGFGAWLWRSWSRERSR